MKSNSVSFNELEKFNDSNSVVMIATTFPEGFDFSEVDEFLSEQLGFSKGKNLIGVHRITGNVLGDQGRADWLLEFDNEDVQFNPVARLRFPDLKWTSDFIYNYKKDFVQDEENKEVKYTLVGVDGNAFAIMGTVAAWMRSEGFSKQEIDDYRKDAMSGDYNNLLCVSQNVVDTLNAR